MENFIQKIVKEDSSSAIATILKIPKNLSLDNTMQDWDMLSAAIKNDLATITSLVTESKTNKADWDLLQNLLFYLNIRDIGRVDRQSLNANYELAIRNAIYHEFGFNNLTSVLDCYENFSPEKAVAEITEKAYAHRICNHPLLKEMSINGLPKDDIKLFLENYYVNNRLFHLFIVTLSLFTPMERRTELANNYYDEMGAGDVAMVHPILFLKNFRNIGLPEQIVPLPESLCLANMKTFAAYIKGDYHYGMGGFGCIELTMPDQMQKILDGFLKSNLPREDLEFWETHITIDVEHGKTWFQEMVHLIRTPDQAVSALNGGLTLLDARSTMYDGIYNCINRARQ